jgi:3-hydroxybutyryl-CoA dehydrogenase
MTNVLVIGAGTMGTQIALHCAMNGCGVKVYDIKEDMLQTSVQKMRTYLEELAGSGVFTEAQCGGIMARIAATTDPREAGKEADVVSESVPEDPALKAAVFRKFDCVCPPDAVFTTNTSSLVPSMIAKKTGRPDRFAAMHFHPPVWETKIVDIAPHPKTSPETVKTLERFVRGINLVPITLKKEHHSYVFNNMLNALLGSAMGLVVGKVASFEDVDRAWMAIMNTKTGPFGIMDYIGLDTVHSVTRYWADKTRDPVLKGRADFLKKYVKEGALGVKTLKGFYTYPDPEYAREDFIK